MNYFQKLFSGIYNLILGLWTTLKYLPKKAVTIQYPVKKMEMFERSRGMVVLLSDPESGELNCTACLLCQKACPVAAISVKQEKNEETKKRYPGKFIVDTTICCFCGLCEEACNFDAIKLAPKYEFATTDKASLVMDMKTLQELGRDVKYTPKKKRAAAAKKPAAAKPAPKADDKTEDKAEEKPEDKAEKNPETTDTPEDKE
jgi:NADH-quinone oxidoreductase subunit I